MIQSLVGKAFNDLKSEKYRDAIDQYLALADLFGPELFQANIAYCKKRLLRQEAKSSFDNEAKVGKILFFTNLALSTTLWVRMVVASIKSRTRGR